MADREKLIEEILLASGGSITGRIRLQKIVYLLEQLGLGGGFRYAYHHYGPYSEGLSRAIDRAKVLKKSIDEDMQPFTYGSGFYSIYKLTKHDPENDRFPNYLGKVNFDQAKEFIRRMKETSSVTIELAATIHWLRDKEKVQDWKAELKARKGSKVTDENLKQATDLLTKLGLIDEMPQQA